MKKIYYIPLLLCLTAVLASAATRSEKQEISRNLDIFNSLYKILQTTYVDTIDAEKSMTTAINVMLNDIDPYTEYIPEKDQEDFMTISTGEFGGIGAYIQQLPSGETMVSEPQEGTPAAKVGLKAGDVFLTIDGDTVTSIGSDKVRERLRGQAGTDLVVTVRRPYVEDSIRTFHITRAKIDVQTVPYYGVARDSIGYILLTAFNEKAAPEVRKALQELLKDPRVKGIALDLRGNGGGLLESAVEIVGMFVPKGTEVLRTRGRGLTNEKIYKTTKAPIDTKIPLVVMIDDGSASSSEITAGALQDLDRAVIVGERSFGKGLVQSTRQLPSNGLLKVTIAKYYIPSGRLIQAIDYSHRNPDGSPARVPDSLTNVFYTRAGREVRDGGGITPDIKVEYPEGNRLVYNIVRDRWDFNFATKYAAEHDSIPAPDKFIVDDELFEQFKASIDPAKFEYDKVCEVIVDELEKAAKREGYLSDEVSAQIESLRQLLKHNLNKDLDNNREIISDYLTSEIVKRYYYNRGNIISLLRTDDAIDRIVQLFGNPDEYKSILSAPKAK